MSYKYVFYGTIHPERVLFHINGLPEIGVQLPGFNIDGKVAFSAQDSKAELVFISDTDTTKYPQKDILLSIRNTIAGFARIWIDAFCYANSYNYDFEIVGVRCAELGIDLIFDVQLETDLAGVYDPNTFLNQVVKLVLKNPEFMFLEGVFSDFRRAIKYPESTGGYFYKAIETIKTNYFDLQAADSEKENEKWDRMNQALGLQKSDYDDLLVFRRYNMHGVYPQITSTERLKLAKDARRIIDLFIDFAKSKAEEKKR